MKLANIHETYQNVETVVFHATDASNLPSIIKNGLGGSGKRTGSNAGQIRNPVHADEYITRHLGAVLQYAYNGIIEHPAVLAFLWRNPGSEFKQDEDEESDTEQYYTSSFAAPSRNLNLLYAWELPVPTDFEGDEKIIQTFGFDPGGKAGSAWYAENTIPFAVWYATGNTAIRWLDKHGKLVYAV
jgi:hypothetical protein